MTHRKKWMAVTLAALAVSSLAIGLAGLFLLHASLLKTAAEQRDLVQENLSSRLEKQLAYFSGTADFLCGKETTRYLTSLARLRPEEDTRALKAAFEDYLHGTALDTHSIQSVCFVGENENQAGYLYETASRREIPVEIPATDSWLRSGLADLLLGDGTLVYIQDDAVEEVLARPYFERYPAQKEAVEEWLGYLSGRYCYVLPRERYGVILVLDSQVFDRLHQAFPWETDGAALCAGDGRILWQTGEWIARARAGEEPVLLDGSLPLADTKLRLYYARPGRAPRVLALCGGLSRGVAASARRGRGRGQPHGAADPRPLRPADRPHPRFHEQRRFRADPCRRSGAVHRPAPVSAHFPSVRRRAAAARRLPGAAVLPADQPHAGLPADRRRRPARRRPAGRAGRQPGHQREHP